MPRIHVAIFAVVDTPTGAKAVLRRYAHPDGPEGRFLYRPTADGERIGDDLGSWSAALRLAEVQSGHAFSRILSGGFRGLPTDTDYNPFYTRLSEADLAHWTALDGCLGLELVDARTVETGLEAYPMSDRHRATLRMNLRHELSIRC